MASHAGSLSHRGARAAPVRTAESSLAQQLHVSRTGPLPRALGAYARFVKNVAGRAVSLVIGDLDLTSLVIDGVDVNRVLDEVDLAALVARLELVRVVDKVDIDDVVARLDLDALVAQIDIDDLVARLDLDALVERLDIDLIVAHLDLDAIVSRLDMDSLVARLDVDAIVRRIDIVGLMGHLAQQSSISALIPGLPRRTARGSAPPPNVDDGGRSANRRRQ